MRCKLLIVAAMSVVVLTAGCSIAERLVYRPDINQGNYLSASDLAKIQKGMTQQQVAYTLGTPMLKEPFGQQVWYYIFRQQPGHETVKQQTLTLTFDRNGILVDIKNNDSLAAQKASTHYVDAT
ncbi:Outer membrane protein assembly factor BamE [Arsenophonus endosymbiont of Aleurodicus floccissimus]|uniref:outer membrane protein assembly factor BamE n=1 Tax=Arsenophonus endosymbiont of Aleurodicus floccissimus TaxID=2152761 RepID=UPI000E6B2AAA|nr:outer membrane protein assembly factor BamE [Arsenophonus endosymbiont of Aleurodicus floccissimus]SPP31727.1 Outer membrane protein assembly factor BamE [Arsenophonus endosymbiont of Aleurodicus floccissimus]